MLQLPDFKEKQIAFVGFNDKEMLSTLKVKNENLVIYDCEGKLSNQVTCSKLFCVFVAGNFTITSNLIKKLLDYGISIFFMNRGSFAVYATLGAVADGNYWLKKNQYSFESELSFCRQLVLNKIENQLSLLKEVKPDFFRGKSEKTYVSDFEFKIAKASCIDELMGIEGAISKTYFRTLFKEYKWYKRMPRTKIDVNNLLLDIGYTFLFNFIDSLLRLHGFDTYKGIYHQLFFQRKSLVCDIVEPFRCIVDKALIKAYHLGQIKDGDFKKGKHGYILKVACQRKYLKIFTQAIMDEKEEIFVYVKKFYFAILNSTNEYPKYVYKIIC